MSIISGLILVILGALAAREFLGNKIAALKPTLEKINTYAEYIGVVGLLLGLLWFLQALSLLRYLDLRPLLVIEVLAASLLTLALGLMFGMPMLHKVMNEPTPAFLTKLDKCVVSLNAHKTNLGLVAIVLGFLAILA